MKKILVFLAFVVISIAAFAGCTSNEDKIVGTWVDESNEQMIFYSDGTFRSEENQGWLDGTWEIKGDEFTIVTEGYTAIYEFEFSNNDNKLKFMGKSVPSMFDDYIVLNRENS